MWNWIEKPQNEAQKKSLFLKKRIIAGTLITLYWVFHGLSKDDRQVFAIETSIQWDTLAKNIVIPTDNVCIDIIDNGTSYTIIGTDSITKEQQEQKIPKERAKLKQTVSEKTP